MSAAEAHLALNHFPIAAMFFGLLFLIVGIVRRYNQVVVCGLLLVVLGGVMSVPLYLSGEPAEEIVEHKPGVTHELIHDHEELAEVAFVFCLITAAVSGIALGLHYKGHRYKYPASIAVTVAAFVTMGILGRTAQLGGMIRHDEVRPGSQFTETINEEAEH